MSTFPSFVKLFCILGFFVGSALPSCAQNYCPYAGQKASSAIPICGTSVFSQGGAQACYATKFAYMNACPSVSYYGDVNAFWYKFTCLQAGTLGFTIRPNNLTDDYDWAVFDITNHNPDDVYSLPGMTVAFNWTDTRGNTGTSAAGTDLYTCYSPTAPAFGVMPVLVQGHEYLIMVCDFNQSFNGYNLDFSGGSAVITDALQPAMSGSWYDETTNTVGIKLNKKLLCSSLSGDASEFVITPGTIAIDAATGIDCITQVDGDTILLQLHQVLPPGQYTITIGDGTDGNSLLDACGRAVPPGTVIQFWVSDLQLQGSPTHMSCHGLQDGSATALAVGGVAPFSYAWNTVPVQRGATAGGLAAGDYTCTVTDAALAQRQVKVTITEPPPLVASAGSDILVYDVHSVSLQAAAAAAGNGLWDQLSGPVAVAFRDPADAGTAVMNMTEGVYALRWTIGDAGCNDSDTITVTVRTSPDTICKLTMPTAFTPNNDGVNDRLSPKGHCQPQQYALSVYNRWGEMIYHSGDPGRGWDGSYKGQAQPAGVYAWMLSYTDPLGKGHFYKGTVMLVR